MQQPRSRPPCRAEVATRREPSPGCLAEALMAANQADWSLSEVGRWLHRLPSWASQLAAPDRFAWQAGLRVTLERHGWGMSNDGRRQLLELACRWHDWPLVVAAGEGLVDDSCADPLLTRALAGAYWHLGESAQALTLLYPLLMARPDDLIAYALYGDIAQWWRWQQSYPLVGEAAADDGELRLEPMGEHHLSDFAWQYHDPAIAELCCLPDFADDAAWINWLRDTHGLGDQLLFAVLHRDWGFIGSVSLILHRGVGFFYYWIGPEYQGSGFGPRAVALMLAAARNGFGMHACYAKAFADNYPSRRGLSKLGFLPMPVRPESPNDDERFYRLGARVLEAESVKELEVLLSDMGSEVRIRRRSIG